LDVNPPAEGGIKGDAGRGELVVQRKLTPLLQRIVCMFGRRDRNVGEVDGGAGRGIPLGGRDERPPTGYRELDDDLQELTDRDFEIDWEESDPADRRRDPLRQP
jgi:hypothetical protein